jgi:hypothetical protein
MSRHEIPARYPAHKVIVGWDQMLLTYFAHVIDRAKEEAGEDDKFVPWIPDAGANLYEIDALQWAIRKYALLSDEIKATLYGDKDDGK